MATTTYASSRTWALLEAAAGGHDQVIIPDSARAVSVTVHPGGGGSAALSVTCSPAADVRDGSAEWVSVSMGGATDQAAAAGTELSPANTAVRLSATGADAEARVAVLV